MFVKINKNYFLALNFKQSQKKPGPPSKNLKEFGLKIIQKNRYANAKQSILVIFYETKL